MKQGPEEGGGVPGRSQAMGLPGFRHLGGHRNPSTRRLPHLDSPNEVINHGHPSVPCPKKVTVPTSEAQGSESSHEVAPDGLSVFGLGPYSAGGKFRASFVIPWLAGGKKDQPHVRRLKPISRTD